MLLTALASQIISCLHCSTILRYSFACNVGLDPMLRGPGASARVILLLTQNQNGSDMFWDAQAVESISNLNLGPQNSVRTLFNRSRNPKQIRSIVIDRGP